MKFAIYAIVAVLAVIPTCAQTATRTHNPTIPAQVGQAGTAPRLADGENEQAVAAELLQNYARCVDGLLLDLANRLRGISERMEAGQLTAEEGDILKLAATRAMIARLETISAVFDALVAAKDDEQESGSGKDSGGDASAPTVRRAERTVSDTEIRQESER